MRKRLFQLLARVNKAVLPRLWDKDLLRLSKGQKLMVAWRYWVTKNASEEGKADPSNFGR
ncbi:MAG: hypothetical protein IPO05_03100 [Flavobacteriales bacterium]|nr:hypothetical protein [Flavobacteriales bacterium]